MCALPVPKMKLNHAARVSVSSIAYTPIFSLLIIMTFWCVDEVTNEELIMTRKFSIAYSDWMAFEEQFHYGCFYAYLKLKEQEIKNVMSSSACRDLIQLVAKYFSMKSL